MDKIKRAMFAKVARDRALKEYTTARRYVEAYEEQRGFDESFADILSSFNVRDFGTEVSDDKSDPTGEDTNHKPRFTAGTEGTEDNG
jgi:hypothetical protein